MNGSMALMAMCEAMIIFVYGLSLSRWFIIMIGSYNEARKKMSNSKKELYKNNPGILSERQIKGRANRWEKQCKPFFLKDKSGTVYGPFKKQKDCYSTGIINHVSLNMLYNGKTNETKGYKLVFLD